MMNKKNIQLISCIVLASLLVFGISSWLPISFLNRLTYKTLASVILGWLLNVLVESRKTKLEETASPKPASTTDYMTGSIELPKDLFKTGTDQDIHFKVQQRIQELIDLNIPQFLFKLFQEFYQYFQHPLPIFLKQFEPYLTSIKKGQIKSHNNQIDCFKFITPKLTFLIAYEFIHNELRSKSEDQFKVMNIFLIIDKKIVYEMKLTYDEINMDMSTFSWGQDEVKAYVPGEWVEPFIQFSKKMTELINSKRENVVKNLEQEKEQELRKKFGLENE